MNQLKGKDIIVLTYADWNASWSTPQQIAARLAPDNRVLFVDQPRSFLYNLKPKDPQGAGTWSGPRVQEVQPNLFVYHPPHAFVPVERLPLIISKRIMVFNGIFLAKGIHRVTTQLGFTNPIVWNFSILHGPAVPLLERSLTIYDICDEWENYIGHETGRQLVRWTESRLCRSADLLFVGTQTAADRRKGVNPELHVVHHGADYGIFSKAQDPATEIPADLAALPRPVIGSVGVIDPARFDVDLVCGLAKAHPAWSFALVGPARADMDLTRLKSCANVYLLGNRPIAELPGYLKGMDVTLIPYQCNQATKDIYPLKLQEYLAAGKPVVSAALPAVLPYGDVVAIAEGVDAFSAAIQAALSDTDAARVAARQAVAQANSWDQRIEEKAEHILRLMAQD
jgi:glycosyltransferase involved in cell wall biosynthesis